MYDKMALDITHVFHRSANVVKLIERGRINANMQR